MKARLLLLVAIALLSICATAQEDKVKTENWITATLRKHSKLLSERSPDSTTLKECYHFGFSKYYLTLKYTTNVIRYTYTPNSKEGTAGNTVQCAAWIPVKDIYHIDYIKSTSTLIIQMDKGYVATLCQAGGASKVFAMGFNLLDDPGLIDKLNRAITRLKQYYKMPPEK